MNPVTVWYRKRIPGQMPADINHIEDGHNTTGRPTVKHPDQARTWRGEWECNHAWLTDDVPPRLVYYGPDDIEPDGKRTHTRSRSLE